MLDCLKDESLEVKNVLYNISVTLAQELKKLITILILYSEKNNYRIGIPWHGIHEN